MQEGQPDRLADLLEEAADAILELRKGYSEEYDAYYDKETGEWLEDKCDDPTCEYCTGRPDRMKQTVVEWAREIDREALEMAMRKK